MLTVENKIKRAVLRIKNGKMIILVDDEDRENEGDLMIAAEKVTPQAINFMAKYARGLICLALTEQKCNELHLNPMVEDNRSKFQTAFTISIEAKEGVTTGISAFDRAKTILTAIKDNARPEDLVRPGHIFPLRARHGGVLTRTGQTEGAVDIATIAGLKPFGVICEIMNEDGTMARLPDLLKFSKKYKIPILSIVDIIKYRLKKESFIEFISEGLIESKIGGEFKILIYEDKLTQIRHLVLIKGRLNKRKPVLVRVHAECIMGNIFDSVLCDCDEQLQKSIQMISQAKEGVILYLRQGNSAQNLIDKLNSYSSFLKIKKIENLHGHKRLDSALKDYGTGAQILSDLGIKKIRLLTNNPRKIIGLKGYGLQIVERIPISAKITSKNLKYLKNKKSNMGHFLSNLEE